MRILKRKEFDRLTSGTTSLAELDDFRFSTGSSGLDEFIGGGVPAGIVTHVYGPPGSGKTNICISAAVACARAGKKVYYMDTEGGFSVERFKQISQSEEIGDRIFLKQPFEFDEQSKAVRGLSKVIDNSFGLLIIDSITSLYRLEIDGDRSSILDLSRELGKELAVLSRVARQNNLSVLICNQVYSSFDKEKEREIVPVGGDVLLYWSKMSLELERSGNGKRIATIRKHPFVAEGIKKEFELVEKGIQ